MSKLTHLNEKGEAHMVDVGGKADSERMAEAEGYVVMQPETLKLIMADGLPKGDVLATARIAGIMATKKTSELIPLCHPLMLSSIKINIEPFENNKLRIKSKVKISGKTGVEMEALTAVSVAALTIYDMAKAVDKAMTIESVKLLLKEGGKSGRYEAQP